MQHGARRTLVRDPRCGAVPEAAWAADAAARKRGREALFNAERADDLAGEDGTVPLKVVVDLAQERYATHELFPKGRVRTYCTFTEVDLEARCEVERVPGTS